MLYLGIGTGINLSHAESQKLIELGECLALCGWKLRCGGRSEVEDKLVEGARRVPEIEPEIILPFPYYRHYDPSVNGVSIFSFLPEKMQHKALSMLDAPSELLIYKSRHQKVMLASGASLAFGLSLNTPVRFALTWVRNLQKRNLHLNQGASIFYTLENRGIPVFNLADPESQARINKFIDSTLKSAI
ncbi:hypothetical protein [Alteromonas sp. 14N.309.X.WAT.G.H12]|uniref:hypothetical protein n=1 Tax=Alteromonas sp. 14N.309.X.WAT.G.H12 TaxID=3120824 RepID=UPI002FD6D75A